jgi:uncharacterized protein (DUF3820 family)
MVVTIKMEDRKELLKEYFDAVQNKEVKRFMEQCIDTIPDYWFNVPASSTGKYHPNYALGNGGLMRHTIAMLRFFERLVRNDLYGKSFTKKELDLLRVACLMHDSRKSGSDEDFKKLKYTRFDHPILAADVVRSIKTKFISDKEKEIIATAIESHMGQWNIDTSKRCKTVLPLPKNKYQKIVHLVDYLAAMKGCEITFDKNCKSSRLNENKESNDSTTVDTYVFPFGKYVGTKLVDVKKEHPDYIVWAKKNIESEPLKTLLTHL